MMNISIIAVGKIKEKYMADFCAEYAKRLSPYCKLRILELESIRLPENPGDKEIENTLAKEAKMIKEKIESGSYVISLCIEGKKLDSKGLADKIEKTGIDGCSHICFIIGSSFGLSDEIKEKSDMLLSMSDMTFPHKLARIMLLEQIYRAFSINNNGKYHK